MKYTIIALLALSGSVFGAANDLLIAQRNSTDTGQLTRLVVHPGGSVNGLVAFDGATLLPKCILIGDGLVWSSGTLSVGMSSAMTTALSEKQDTIPAGISSQYYRGDKTWATFPAIPAAQVQTDWNAVSGMGVLLNKPSLAAVATSGAYSDLAGRPTLSTVATSGNYADLSGKPSIPAAQIQADWTQTNSGSVDFIKNKPVPATATASRSFNSAFQVSTTKNAEVRYTVEITSSISLAGTNAGTIFLETSPDNSAWTEEGRIVNAQGGGLVVGLSLTQTFSAQLTAYVPSSYYVRLRSVVASGTPTFTIRQARETTLS